VHVLRNMINSVEPGGLVLDLQVIRPNPRVEVDDRSLCEIDGTPLFRLADAATAAVDTAIVDGRLVEEDVDDHDVRKHYRTGADLVQDFAGKERRVPTRAVPVLRAIAHPCVVRERCRLRRLRTVHAAIGSRAPSALNALAEAAGRVAAAAEDLASEGLSASLASVRGDV
jgi:hypothetical protein